MEEVAVAYTKRGAEQDVCTKTSANNLHVEGRLNYHNLRKAINSIQYLRPYLIYACNLGGSSDAAGRQTRVSHDVCDLDVNSQVQHLNIADDVAVGRPNFGGDAQGILGHGYPDPIYSSFSDKALAPYQRSASYPARDNALQLRVSISSSESEPHSDGPANNTERRTPMESSPVPSSLSPSPIPSISTPNSNAIGSRASSLDPSVRRLQIASERDDQSEQGAPDKQSNGKATRPSLSRIRVRFRSRVRIGSGMRHSKHECTGDCSPSSSISAPLRESADQNDVDAFWQLSAPQAAPVRPNGQVELIDDMFGFDGAAMSSSSSSRSLNSQRSRRSRRLTGMYPFPTNGQMSSPNERTPLTSSLQAHSYYSQSHSTAGRHIPKGRARRRAYLSDITDLEEDLQAREGEDYRARRHSLERAARKRDEELVFGRWPWRLVNGYVSYRFVPFPILLSFSLLTSLAPYFPCLRAYFYLIHCPILSTWPEIQVFQ